MASILKLDQLQSDSGTVTLASNLVFSGASTFVGNIANPTITGTLNLTGGGIKFPATQSASVDANTLDDYEEGTWTPSFTASGTSFTHAVQSGLYVKVGSLVFAQFYLRATAYSGTNSNITITGMPFVSVNSSVYNQSPGSMWSTTTTQAVALLTNNGAVADLWKQGSSVTIFTASEITGAYFVGSFIYRAT